MSYTNNFLTKPSSEAGGFTVNTSILIGSIVKDEGVFFHYQCFKPTILKDK